MYADHASKMVSLSYYTKQNSFSVCKCDMLPCRYTDVYTDLDFRSVTSELLRQSNYVGRIMMQKLKNGSRSGQKVYKTQQHRAIFHLPAVIKRLAVLSLWVTTLIKTSLLETCGLTTKYSRYTISTILQCVIELTHLFHLVALLCLFQLQRSYQQLKIALACVGTT